MGASLTVPFPFDVVIDEQGYILYDGEEQKAAFGLSSVFVPRTNTEGGYGDSQQDFWYTWSQKDWAAGEQQKYQGRSDDDKARFWRGKNVDVRIPGEVTVRPDKTSITFASNPKSVVGHSNTDLIYWVDSTNLRHTDSAGNLTNDGAHGVGATPSRFGLTMDALYLYISTTSGATVGVRRFDPSGPTFSTFSNAATTGAAADSLAFLNNTLYGYREVQGDLIRYDSTGVFTSLFTWRSANGTAIPSVTTKLAPYGGKLLILRYRNTHTRGAELWLYDGVAPARLAEFPSNFAAYDMEVVGSTVFVSGTLPQFGLNQPVIFFYKDGQQDPFWEAEASTATSGFGPPLVPYGRGLLFGDSVGFGDDGGSLLRLVYYDSVHGGFSTAHSAASLFGASAALAAAATFVLIIPSTSSGTTGYVWGGTGTLAASAQVDSPRVDFDSSLPKVLRGIRVLFDGGGGTSSVDIAYSVDGGAYTTLQTGAVSGTEYKITPPAEGTTHQFIQIRVTLNVGSGNSPKLKRIQARAVPVQPAFKQRQYVLHLGGRDGKSHVTLRGGDQQHSLDGKQMATNLQTSAGRTSPFTITDHLGSYTGIIEKLQMIEYKPEQWLATVTCREV